MDRLFGLNCAVPNESHDRILDDVKAIYFNISISVQVWVGLKVCRSRVEGEDTFCIGWVEGEQPF